MNNAGRSSTLQSRPQASSPSPQQSCTFCLWRPMHCKWPSCLFGIPHCLPPPTKPHLVGDVHPRQALHPFWRPMDFQMVYPPAMQSVCPVQLPPPAPGTPAHLVGNVHPRQALHPCKLGPDHQEPKPCQSLTTPLPPPPTPPLVYLPGWRCTLQGGPPPWQSRSGSHSRPCTRLSGSARTVRGGDPQCRHCLLARPCSLRSGQESDRR